MTEIDDGLLEMQREQLSQNPKRLTDRGMLLIAYGALRALAPKCAVVEEIEEYLYPTKIEYHLKERDE